MHEGIAFHKMVGVFRGPIKLRTVYLPYDYIKKKQIILKKIKEEGIYVFGGKNQNQ